MLYVCSTNALALPMLYVCSTNVLVNKSLRFNFYVLLSTELGSYSRNYAFYFHNRITKNIES